MPEESDNNREWKLSRYFVYMIIILTFIQILISYISTAFNIMPSKIIKEFLGNYELNAANAIYSLYMALASVGYYLAFGTQFLADKFGRKRLLILSVVGFSLTSLAIFFSLTIVDFSLFIFLQNVAFSTNTVVIYVSEESPPSKRGVWLNLVMLGSVAGTIAAPIVRAIFITETVSNWRMMMLFPVFIGLPISILILFTFKETSKYIQLRKTKSFNDYHISIKKSIPMLFKHSQKHAYIAILVMSLLRGFNLIFVYMGESFLSQNPNFSTNDINIIVFIIAIAAIFGYVITGVVADSYGRLPLLYLYSVLYPAATFMTLIGMYLPIYSLLVVGIAAGLLNAVFWGITNISTLYVIEITPTELRGAATGFKMFCDSVGATLGLLLSSVITIFYGLGASLLTFSLLFLLYLPIIRKYLKETKGIPLA